MPKRFTTIQKFLIAAAMLGILGAFVFFATASGGTKFASTLSFAATPGNLSYGLVGHWTFDGLKISAASTTAEITNELGQGYPFDYFQTTGSTAFTQGALTSGVIGQALKLDQSTTDFLRSLRFSDNITGDFSFSAWIKSSPDYTGTTLGTLMTEYSGGNSLWSIGVGDTTSGSAGDNLFNAFGVYSTTPVADNRWHHVTATYRSSGTAVEVYVDGVRESTGSVSVSHGGSAYYAGLTIVSNIGLHYYSGAVDDLRLYNRVITADEAKHLYQLGATTKVATTPAASPQQGGLNYGLVGHWTFDGKNMPSGQVNDISGRANHGSQRNMATSSAYVRGTVGQGLRLDGTNDFVDVSNTSGLSVTGSQVTLAAWFNNDGNPTGLHRILSMPQNEGGGAEKMTLVLDGTNSRLAFYIGTNAPSGDDQAASTTFTGKGSWRHVVGTYNAPTMKIYLDGVLQQTYTHTAPGTSIDSNDNGNFQIGRYGPTFGQYFGGTVDDARVYSRTLSDDEVKQLYQLGATTKVATTPAASPQQGGLNYGLVGHWTFDGKNMPSGQVNDVSASAYHGSLRNAATSSVYARGLVGQALDFDGTDDGILLGSSNLGRNVSGGTISAWVKRDVNSSLDPIVDINTAASGDRFQLAVDSSNRARIISRSDDSESVSSMTIASPTVVKENGWVHLVGTIDYPNDLMEIFINGVSAGTGAATYSLNASSDTAPASVHIGYDAGSGFFDGIIDDVRVYNRVLTISEIRHLYQIGVPN